MTHIDSCVHLFNNVVCVCGSIDIFVAFIFIVLCSIYKSMLKSKGTINEVNQIAQVSFDISLRWLHSLAHSPNFFLLSLLANTSYSIYFQLRIIIKPKPYIGVGPLCNAQQVNSCLCHYCWCYIVFRVFLIFISFLSMLYVDMLPCSWGCPCDLGSHSSSST